MKFVGLASLLALAGGTAHAQVVQWTGPGANGHYYQALSTSSLISWADASAQVALAGRGGYLATITSAAENSFLFSLIDSPQFWNTDTAGNSEGAFIGGLQTGGPEPLGGWQWVSGEPWSFTAWHGSQPDNAGGAENYLQFFGGTGSARLAQWNDISLNQQSARAYIVEYDTNPLASAPEPSSLLLCLVAGLGVTGRSLWKGTRSHA